jgi:hypothetical protein
LYNIVLLEPPSKRGGNSLTRFSQQGVDYTLSTEALKFLRSELHKLVKINIIDDVLLEDLLDCYNVLYFPRGGFEQAYSMGA